MIRLRGDWHVCPNPLSASPYTTCQYNCVYCFVRHRESFFKQKPEFLPRRVDKVKRQLKKFEFLLEKGIPIVIGDNCEALCEAEQDFKATYELLKILRDHDVPVVIETKGYLFDFILKILGEMNSGVNYSITPGRDIDFALWEPGLPTLSDRFYFVRTLKELGIWVGIKAEPILHGITDKEELVRDFARRCVEAGVENVNFGDLRISFPIVADRRFREVGLDLLEIVRAKKNWRETGLRIYEILKEEGIKRVYSPDWINFGFLNDCVSCCGFDGRFGYHKFNFQYAVKLLKEKKKVCLMDLLQENPGFPEDKFLEVWNNSKKYYNLSDLAQKRGECYEI